MDNSQYTPRTLIPPIDRILMDNAKQSLGITSGYNDTNPELTIPGGKIIKGSDGKVLNINSQGVTTYYPTSDVYDQTSGERGIPGSGNFSVDKSSIPSLPYVINPNVTGYDENSKLYLNGKIRQGQSQGDEAGNMFAGIKTPGNFEYKGCSVMPLDGTYQVGDTPGELQIIDVSYGSNCGNATGNRTQNVKDYISQHPNSLSYDISRNTISFGDPFGGCNKFMSVTYDCNGHRQTVTRDDGLFDSGASLNITCKSQDSSLSKCYYDALAKGLSYFGLGNVDSNTNRGTCYAGGSDMLNNWWQNPGIPIWKIDMRKAFNYQGHNITNFFLGRNNNAYFSENGIHTEGDWSFYQLCKAGKLPNANPSNAQAFASDWNDDTRAMFLANGNLYLFSFPVSMTLPSDLRENPQNYGQYMIYSSGTQGQTLHFGWTDRDILTGVDDNILLATPSLLGSLAIGQSIYSSDGKLRLKLNTDYSLVLYTGDPNAVGCNTDMSNNNVGYGGIAVNQINDMNTNGEKNFGKLAYVNRLGSAYEYKDPLLFHYTDTYTTNPGYTINNIDSNKNATKYITPNGSIGIAYDGSPDSIANCQLQCSKSGNCVGTVVDNGNCYLLDAINNDDIVYKDEVKVASGYKTYEKTQLYGYDIGNYGQVPNPETCMSNCDKINGCVGVEYWPDSGYCFPKNKDGPPHMALSDGSSVYLKEDSYTSYSSKGIDGYDIASGVGGLSIDGCKSRCDGINGCVGFEYWNSDGSCFVKNKDAPPHMVGKGSNNSVYLKKTQQGQPIMNLRVPEINKEGQPSYSVYPNNDLWGADLGPTNTNTANDCLDICNKTEGCYSVAFLKGGNGVGTCYPKTYKETTNLSLADNIDAYIRNPEKIENPTEATYTEYPHHWINGYDLGAPPFPTPHAKDCMKGCNEKEGCVGFEYWDWNGYCFLKSKDGLPHMAQTDGNNAIYVKNPAPAGTSYLIPSNVNVVDPNKFANYNITGSPMTNTTHDVSLMPESITNNFLLTSSQLKDPNDKIVRETDRIIRESFTSTQMYQENDKYLSKLDDTLNNYKSRDHKLQPNIITLNKMVSNSSIQMRYLNIMYSILFIIVCILLVVAFTISL
jgi:hypothetical protein